MNVDDAIRELRSSVRGPADGLVDQIVAAAPAAPRVSRGRRVNGRAILVAACVSVAVALVLTLGFVIRDGNRPDPVPAAPAIPPARVGWGMVATVKLTPDPGVSIKEMRERFTTALAVRTDDEGGAGVEVVSADGDEVTVRLPGAETRNQVDDYLRFLRMVIVDDEASVIATAPSIRALPDVPGASGGPRNHYVQEQDRDGTWSAPQQFASREEAEKWNGEQGDRRAIISVPATVSVVGGQNGAPVQLVRRTPVIPSSAIQGMRYDGDDVFVLTDPRHRLNEDRRVSVFAGPGETGEPDRYASLVGTGVLTRDGGLRLPVHRWSLIPSVARPDLGGTTAVRSVSSYGTKAPETFEDDRTPRVPGTSGWSVPAESRWVRISVGRFDGREILLLGAEYRGVLIATAFHHEGLAGYPNGGGSVVGTNNPGQLRSACPVGIGTPLVVKCGGSGGTNRAKNGKVPVMYTDFGRVRPGVARIAVRIADRQYDAVIRNGWWMIWVEDEFPLLDDGQQGLGKTEIVNSATVLAWDADGRPIPVSPRTIIRGGG